MTRMFKIIAHTKHHLAWAGPFFGIAQHMSSFQERLEWMRAMEFEKPFEHIDFYAFEHINFYANLSQIGIQQAFNWILHPKNEQIDRAKCLRKLLDSNSDLSLACRYSLQKAVNKLQELQTTQQAIQQDLAALEEIESLLEKIKSLIDKKNINTLSTINERLLKKGQALLLNVAALVMADLSSLNLSELDLSGLDLRGADLTKADLSGANLSGANLRGVDLRGGAGLTSEMYNQIWPTDRQGMRIDRSQVALLYRAGVRDFSCLNLSGLDLGGLDLRGADFTKADLSGADLTATRLTPEMYNQIPVANRQEMRIDQRQVAFFSGAIFSGADLTATRLTPEMYNQIPVANRQEMRIDQRQVALLYHADVRDFSCLNLSGLDLSGLDLRGADLTKADLSGAIFSGVDLRGGAGLTPEMYNQIWPTDRQGMRIDQSQVALLYRAGVRDFSGLNLSGLNLRGLGLRGADPEVPN